MPAFRPSVRRAAVPLGTVLALATLPIGGAAAQLPRPTVARDTGAVPELVTDRPDYTESPLAVPFRSVQVEAGSTIDRTGGTVSSAVGEVLLRIGVVRRAELRIGLNSYTTTLHARPGDGTIGGLEDATVGAKVQLVDGPSRPSFAPTVAVLVGTSVPTGSAPLRHTMLEPEAKLALGWTLPGGWELSSNVNVASSACEGDGCTVAATASAPARLHRRTTETAASLSAGHDLGERVGAYAELFGGRPTVGAGWQYANTGVTLGVTPVLQLDLRGGVGIGSSRGDYFLGAGLSRRF